MNSGYLYFCHALPPVKPEDQSGITALVIPECSPRKACGDRLNLVSIVFRFPLKLVPESINRVACGNDRPLIHLSVE